MKYETQNIPKLNLPVRDSGVHIAQIHQREKKKKTSNTLN